jgi:hypothetical protein
MRPDPAGAVRAEHRKAAQQIETSAARTKAGVDVPATAVADERDSGLPAVLVQRSELAALGRPRDNELVEPPACSLRDRSHRPGQIEPILPERRLEYDDVAISM